MCGTLGPVCARLDATLVPCALRRLDELEDWEIRADGIFEKQARQGFSVEFYRCETSGREVRAWSQPLINSHGMGRAQLLDDNHELSTVAPSMHGDAAFRLAGRIPLVVAEQWSRECGEAIGTQGFAVRAHGVTACTVSAASNSACAASASGADGVDGARPIRRRPQLARSSM